MGKKERQLEENRAQYRNAQVQQFDKGVASLVSGRYAQAEAEFNAVDTSYSEDLFYGRFWRVHECYICLDLKAAEDLMSKGDYTKAKDIIEKCGKSLQTWKLQLETAEAQKPSNLIRFHATKASLFSRKTSIESSITKCENYIEYQKAQDLLSEGKYSDALKIFENVGEYFRETSTSSVIEGCIAVCKKNIPFDEVEHLIEIKNYQEALSKLDTINPSKIVSSGKIGKLKGKIYFEIAEIKSEKKEYVDTLVYLDRALEFDNSKEYWTFKAKICKELKKYTEAIKCANKALEIDGTHAEAKQVKLEAVKNNRQIIQDAFGGVSVDKLKVDGLFAGIELLEQIRYCDADGQRITMVIGSTRCGKSTTLNLLLGNPLVSKEQNDGGAVTDIVLVKKNADPGNLYPVIGNRTTSETSLPTKYELDGLQLWDCPGFGDSRGAQQEIINAWFINRLFQTASEVKLINLCVATSFAVKTSSNVTEFTNYIKQILDIFGKENIAKVKQLLVFTKTNSEITVDQYRITFSKLINEHFPADPEVLQFFRESRVTKIDEVKKVDLELTRSYIPELASLYSAMPYQKMKPHVRVDDKAKEFFHKSVSELACITKQSLKNIFKEESGQFLQNLKLKLAAIASKDQSVVKKEVKATIEVSREALLDNKSVTIKLKYFDDLSEFVATIVEWRHVKEIISSTLDNFRVSFKNTLEKDVNSIVNSYETSGSDQTFGEYSWENPCLLGKFYEQIDEL